LIDFAMQSTVDLKGVLEVQRWTRARSECLPGGGGKNYSYATATPGSELEFSSV